jgi:hypothetical protein
MLSSSVRGALHHQVLRPILHKYYFFSSWTARKFVGLSTSILQKTPSSSSAYLQLISKRHIWKANEPGDLAFAAGEVAAVSDLFFRYANTSDGGIDDEGCSYLTPSGARKMLASIGENPDDETFDALFRTADLNGDGKLQLQARGSIWIHCLSEKVHWHLLTLIETPFHHDFSRLYFTGISSFS